MRHLTMFLSALLMLGCGLLIASHSAQSQDAPVVPAGHALVGGWLADTDPEDANSFDSVFLFHDDGTFMQLEANDGETPGQSYAGVWAATGDNSADLTIIQVVTNIDGLNSGTNSQFIIRASIEVAEDGQSFTAQYTFEMGGMPGIEGQYGPGSASGTRIAVEPMGTPVGSFEDIYGGFEGDASAEATPAA